MQISEDWLLFFKTGDPRDYLRYCEGRNAAGSHQG